MKVSYVPPSPTPYQGGKAKFAGEILDIIKPNPDNPFWDLCCGGGSVSLEAVRRGHPVSKLTMVDAGPWGEVWREIGLGSFPLSTLSSLIRDFPTIGQMHEHFRWLSNQIPKEKDRPAVFLILQAGSWGGRAIGWNGKWEHEGFRKTCGCGPKCNHFPMRPSPETLYERVELLSETMVGMTGICSDIAMIQPNSGMVYIDPPYIGTKGYQGRSIDAMAYAKTLRVPCWISEGKRMTPQAFCLLEKRKGGIKGSYKDNHEEWLSYVSNQTG